MGIETLTKAERAAGFAMASPEDSYNEQPEQRAADVPAPVAAVRAQTTQPEAIRLPVLRTGTVASYLPRGTWVRGVFSIFGRGAPA
jgi:hypothetical protein